VPFRDLEQRVCEDVEFLREAPLSAGETEIRGFVDDVETRRLTEPEQRRGRPV
jgi:hypothetical protein